MDPWDVFAELCKQVVENENVYLDVLITHYGIEMKLMPYNEEDFNED